MSWKNAFAIMWVHRLATRVRLPAPVLVMLLMGLGTAGVLGAAWLRLTDAVVDRDGLVAVDGSVLTWMVGHRDGTLTTAAQTASVIGAPVTLAATAGLAVAMLSWHGRRRAATLVAVTGIGAWLLVVVAKHIIGRARPPLADQVIVETNHAFPSGHAFGSTAVLGVLTVVALGLLRSRVARVATILIATSLVLLVGLSRLYLGVHWATDVAGGWLLGSAWLSACLAGSAAFDRAGSWVTVTEPAADMNLTAVDIGQSSSSSIRLSPDPDAAANPVAPSGSTW